MESSRPLYSQPKCLDSKDVKVIRWEDFEQELARLCSLSSALKEAEQKKSGLKEKLDPLIQVQTESLSRSNELVEMHKKLVARELAMERTLVNSKCVTEDSKKQVDRLSNDVRSLLVAGTNLSAASKKLQEGNMRLSGEGGYVHLRSLQTMLRKRQQYLISRVSFLYPVKALVEPGHELELESFPRTSRSGNSSGSRHLREGALSISGLQLTMLPFTRMSFFTDKKIVRRSATALGYVAHAVSLIASYLDVHLRYPLRLGGSHTYIRDPAPSLSSDSLSTTPSNTVEFPLFLDGQDATRAAYAVFLLNKDLEQVLNLIGVGSLGPRHVLANLKEVVGTVLSPEYLGR